MLRRAAVTLVAVAWISFAYCGEIHDAARKGDLESVKALLKDNPELVNDKDDNYGATPLHWAAAGGYQDVVELLLVGKAEVNAKD
jgi:ankyrin repeat protein